MNTITSDTLTASELLALFEKEVTVGQMKKEEFKTTFQHLQHEASKGGTDPYIAPNYSTAYLVNYCIGYMPPFVQTAKIQCHVS